MNLLIIPFGTPHWSPKSENVSEINRLHSKTTRVIYLLPFWGLMGAYAISHNPELLRFIHGIGLKERELMEETAINIRSWLINNGSQYDKIIFLAYANGSKFWSKGAAGLKCMKKVRIVRFKSSSPGTVKNEVFRSIQ